MIYIGNNRYKAVSNGAISSLIVGTPTTPPFPYQRVEYIETNGTQYIDTGILLSQMVGFPNTYIKLSIEWTNTRAGIQYQMNGWGNNPQIGIKLGTTSYWQNYATGNQPISENVNYEVTLDLSGSRGVLKVDGFNDLTAGGNTYSRPHSFCIGTMRQTSGTLVFPAWEKIHKCQIVINNVVAFDGYPVRVGTVGYLYDTVSQQLFGNVGTGDFILGSDI